MRKPKIILGIESSCDETSAAVALKDESGVHILSNIVASSASLQAKYGGVIPEQAAREQLKSIVPVIQEALNEARVTRNEIDAIAVTEGPGLIGSLLVGVETAKVLATVWQKPLVPINHLIGHFYANWILNQGLIASSQYLGNKKNKVLTTNYSSLIPKFPCLGLLVSGGHTDLVIFEDHSKYRYIGGTRDDAAGECFDKSARILGLPYPGGPEISKAAEQGDPKKFRLPRPMLDSGDFDFSFSGLKTAVLNQINQIRSEAQKISDSENLIHRNADTQISSDLSEQDVADIAASLEEAIVDTLVKKTVRAAKTYNTEQIVVAGGVAANKKLKEVLTREVEKEIPNGRVHIPPPQLCTDNAAYIATAAFFNFHPIEPLKLQANPNLSLNN